MIVLSDSWVGQKSGGLSLFLCIKAKNQSVSRAGLWRGSQSRLSQVVGKILFPAVIRLRSHIFLSVSGAWDGSTMPSSLKPLIFPDLWPPPSSKPATVVVTLWVSLASPFAPCLWLFCRIYLFYKDLCGSPGLPAQPWVSHKAPLAVYVTYSQIAVMRMETWVGGHHAIILPMTCSVPGKM